MDRILAPLLSVYSTHMSYLKLSSTIFYIFFESSADFQIVARKSFAIYPLYCIFVLAQTSSIECSGNGPHTAYITKFAVFKFIIPLDLHDTKKKLARLTATLDREIDSSVIPSS